MRKDYRKESFLLLLDWNLNLNSSGCPEAPSKYLKGTYRLP